MAESEPAIAVQELSHRYSDGRQSLFALSFVVASGESVGLVGPNGAGKTTLFLCLAGIFRPFTGTLRVCGLDPTNEAERRLLPAHLGIVFQNPDDQLFNTTVETDVAFGPLNLGLSEAEVRQRTADALAVVGLSKKAGRAPNKLSGGEKRRAALAGILAMQPSVLLLDEPTMFLDPRGRRELIDLLNRLPGTKVIATHDLDLVLDCCPRSLILDEGKLCADGASRDLLADRVLVEKHGLEVPWRLRDGNITAERDSRRRSEVWKSP